MRMQTLVEGKIINMIEDVGLTATIEKNWANTGAILGLDPDNLNIRISIHFDFQSTYFSLEVYEGHVVTFRRSDAAKRVSTVNGKPVSEALEEIRETITVLVGSNA